MPKWFSTYQPIYEKPMAIRQLIIRNKNIYFLGKPRGRGELQKHRMPKEYSISLLQVLDAAVKMYTGGCIHLISYFSQATTLDKCFLCYVFAPTVQQEASLAKNTICS